MFPYHLLDGQEKLNPPASLAPPGQKPGMPLVKAAPFSLLCSRLGCNFQPTALSRPARTGPAGTRGSSVVTVTPVLHHSDITAWRLSPGNREWKTEEMAEKPCLFFMGRASQEANRTVFAVGVSCRGSAASRCPGSWCPGRDGDGCSVGHQSAPDLKFFPWAPSPRAEMPVPSSVE